MIKVAFIAVSVFKFINVIHHFITIANDTFDAEVCLKLKSADFNKAELVPDDFYQVQTSAVCKEYYLFDFNDHELMEIIFKPDEWGSLIINWPKKFYWKEEKKLNRK